MKYNKNMLKDYGLTKEAFNIILNLARIYAPACYDNQTGEYNAGLLAETVAEDLMHDEWLDDEHPIYDVCADICITLKGAV
jgi:hypothetical protein